jgi:hypothetical protein
MRRLAVALFLVLSITAALAAVLVYPGLYDRVYGSDNFTSSANVSLDLFNPEDIEVAMAASANIISQEMEQTAEIISQKIEDTADSLIATVLAAALVILITALAFWKENSFIYLLAVPVDITYGLNYASTKEVNSAAWVAGVIVAIIGTWCLFHVAVKELPDLVKRARKRLEGR